MKNLLIMLVLLMSSVVEAQKLPSDGFDKIRIAEPDKTIQADLKTVSSEPDMEVDRTYYWYSGNSIHMTQGGYSGRLLNGDYKEYYLNKNLKELGEFKRGLKNGVWRSWNENGLLIQLYTWKNGIRQGVFSLFDDNGRVRQSGSYKHDSLNGKIISYSGTAVPAVVIYHNGNEVVKKPSSTFWNKINILKRKKRTNLNLPTKNNGH